MNKIMKLKEFLNINVYNKGSKPEALYKQGDHLVYQNGVILQFMNRCNATVN